MALKHALQRITDAWEAGRAYTNTTEITIIVEDKEWPIPAIKPYL